ncbi:AraC-like ligand-binding domain-containing protein, partial [Escherichia coli]
MNPAVDNEFQQWLSQINQVCGNFTGRLLTERYTGVLDTHFAKGLKLSTVTTSGVNLSRTWQEVKGSDDAWFYTVFQLSGQAIMEQDERQVQIGAGLTWMRQPHYYMGLYSYTYSAGLTA